jgi:hypothetical protein
VRHLPKQSVAGELTDRVEIDLQTLERDVDRVAICASAEDSPFALVSDLRLSLYATGAAEPLAYFDVVPDTGSESALICGELYRRGDGWKFRALGQGYVDGLAGLATEFGISVDEEGTAGRPDAPAPDVEPTSVPQPVPAAEPEPDGYPLPAPTVAAQRTHAQPAHAQPAYGYPPAQAPTVPAYGYGYPQTQQAPAAGSAGPAPAYGYPQQSPPPSQPMASPTAFALPPQGPQFQERR